MSVIPDVTPEAPAPSSPSWMRGIIAAAVGMLGMWLFARREPRWAPTTSFPTRDWHHCSVCIFDRSLIRPHELMCAQHWQLVPVLLRIWLHDNRRERGPQSEAWLLQAYRAIDFVEDWFRRQSKLRYLKPGSRVPEAS